MKKTINLLLLAVGVISCSAMPPAHKPAPAIQFTLTLPAVGTPAVTGANIYKAHSSDTNWTLFATVPGANGQALTTPVDTDPWELYTADATNTVLAAYSDYTAIFTNATPPRLTTPALAPK